MPIKNKIIFNVPTRNTYNTNILTFLILLCSEERCIHGIFIFQRVYLMVFRAQMVMMVILYTHICICVFAYVCSPRRLNQQCNLDVRHNAFKAKHHQRENLWKSYARVCGSQKYNGYTECEWCRRTLRINDMSKMQFVCYTLCVCPSEGVMWFDFSVN